ncbi:DEAD/DEAH box helicase [Arcanobacterium phocisimile]|uniref:DEAD/DEAH box helicase n=2 Tax=Arcanobacterium phocisimile TaxID=1302235 RepID=A0ABX7IKG0_9ACTO|nr:DEAD/DEAH box helicase [Arcanobacterium phocisimile]
MTALGKGRDVFVSAPTGSGKTVVAECAVEFALASSSRCIYTAPIKALSNQKFKDLQARYGEEYVGLVTGDVVINREAQILVVTTEVVRNMLLTRDSEIADIGYVVLDEVHFLGDPFRGPVWEEIILQLPGSARLVSLSATVANIDEFTSWLRSVRGTTEVVTSMVRPVPLEQFVATKRSIVPLFDDEGGAAFRPQRSATNEDAGRRRRGKPAARRRQVLRMVQERGMLPAIHFIFSRKGCDQAVADLLDADVFLTSKAESDQIRQRLATLTASLSVADARTIRFGFWAKALSRGFAAHHAGMFPAIKELAEELMDAGLLKLVYATGTLALGVDMPVRTVIIEDLIKWNGEDFVAIGATEYTQLIGRAGRRGKDSHGNAVVVATPDLDVDHLLRIGSGEVDQLMSAFFPSYNTVVNLLSYYTYDQARAIMGQSFAQYQKNADLGQIEAKLGRIDRRIARISQTLNASCELGSVTEYLDLLQAAGRASKAERRRAKESYKQEIDDSWNAVVTGMLYAFARGGELDYGVVLSISERKIRVVDIYGELFWVRRDDLSSQLRELGFFDIPFGRSVRDRQVRNDIAELIEDRVAERVDLDLDADLERSWDRHAVRTSPVLEAHPVHSCPERYEHRRAGSEYMTLMDRKRELLQLRDSYEGSVAREFDATVSVLENLGYLRFVDDRVKLGVGGSLLKGIHSEADALTVMCMSEPIFAELSPAKFAGVCSALLCDRRFASQRPRDPQLRAAWERIEANMEDLVARESAAGIVRTGVPTPGGIEAFTLLASGADLEAAVASSRLAVGDIVNANRRLIDILGQLVDIGSDSWLGESAYQARELLRRWDWN